MSYIIEKLYLGGLEEAYKTRKLLDKGITHILTIERQPLSLSHQKGFTYKFVQALDMESTDILRELTPCLEFIEEGRQSGGVLVHCLVGQSRSATVVIAYIMQKLDMCLNDALTIVRKQRPQIKPNHGFMDQLQLFESMGNQINLNSPQYKMYRLGLIASMVQQGGDISKVFGQMGLSSDPTSLQHDPTATVYKCKKCRRLLFRQSSILPHDVGMGDAAFDWRKKSQDPQTSASDDSICTQSLFIEPVQWMENDIHEIEGKLSCPKCASKLGSYNWYGERCPCGSWVTPAIHIQSSKVDKCIPPKLPPPKT